MSAFLISALAFVLFPPVTIGVLLFLVALRDAWSGWLRLRALRARYWLRA